MESNNQQMLSRRGPPLLLADSVAASSVASDSASHNFGAMVASGMVGYLNGRSWTLCDKASPPSTSCNVLHRPVPQNRTHTFASSGFQVLRKAQEEHRRAVSIKATKDGQGDDEEEDEEPRRKRGRGVNRTEKQPKDDDSVQRDSDGFEERVLQVSRVTKVVKGGKQMSFRAVVAVGDDKGKVGVGCASAKEVITAVEKAASDAKRHIITIPITRGFSFPHRVNGIAGGAKVMLRPASEGTGVIAGGAVREVLELSGIKNAFGKQLGSDNPLNNARATIDGLLQMRTLSQAARDRDLSVEQMLGYNAESAATPAAA